MPRYQIVQFAFPNRVASQARTQSQGGWDNPTPNWGDLG